MPPAQPQPGVPSWVKAIEHDGAPAIELRLKVVPGASRDAVVGPLGDRLKIRVAAPPEDGRANKAVCALLARALGVTPNAVEIVAGQTSPAKTALVRGLTPPDADRLL